MKPVLHFYVRDNERCYYLSDENSYLLHEFEDFFLYRDLQKENAEILHGHPFIEQAEKYLERFRNPYRYSLDNKRYFTWDSYGKLKYGRKLVKIPLEAGFSCPNRDGTLSTLGCLYCAGGSDSFPDISGSDLKLQYSKRMEIFRRKWPDFVPLAYFQSYSNTYAPLEHLKELFTPFAQDPDIAGMVISTRSDCLDHEKISWLNSLSQSREIWLELGLQSVHDQTLREMNRGHDFASFERTLDLLKDTDLMISVHLINGWPTESKEMMLETARRVGRMPIHAVKFHMLHVMKETPLADRYPFEMLSKDQYVETVGHQITLLRPDIIIERLTGDGLQSALLGPDWTRKKTSVINDIDKWLVSNDCHEGSAF
ncbi:MAG: TIGR01212 family radical SAM protein [Erysipelotrichaceae bacterium]|nr:TIGR01212 family radical SAM protein [Erysipelotrichaceae bacterium]